MKGDTVMKNQKGFTLIEIVVTVVIVAVLMAVAVPISLSFMDDIHEQRILAEGQEILSIAQSQISRISLEGKYLEETTAEGRYNLNDEIRKRIVERANGSGILNKLVYYNGKVTGMRYYIDNRYIVLDGYGTDLFIDTHSTPDDIAEFIANSDDTFKEIKKYFDGHKENNSAIDSKAPSKTTDPNLAGIGDKIRIFLVNMGVDINNSSWVFILRNNGYNNKTIYELMVYDGDIDDVEVNAKIKVLSYYFFPDGTKIQEKFSKEKEATVQKHSDPSRNYLVIR